MSIQTARRPPARTPTSQLLWAVSDGAFENHFVASTTEAALWLTDESMRRHLRSQDPFTLSVHLQDPFLGVLWDATSNVVDIFKATGWPRQDETTLHLRAAVISLIREILISDETPHDAPFPGISDPHTYALVCR
ncbi:hypothetical protein [Paenarthrobacter sp. YJN-5]|uniref:hypothetical protein n=1 Tax=Paenarthrobacter sp. YJN-5 TaxID=2735316 RepID=UPI001877CB71|nr:hypothetical protein [Paenarthrobacter sp. YJN-5]QOT19259.1 hypothetical protein HMI59_21355 [Paenarthrobacter sp. YJN-5]